MMKVNIRDTWIRHGDVEVGRGEDRLVFERCIFAGGTVKVDPEVDRKILYIAYSKARVSRHNPIVPGSPSIAIGKHQTPRTRVKGPHSLTDLANVDRSPGVGSGVK
jgi:hypothetical protein